MRDATMLIATICTRTHLPRARVLAQSFLDHAPDGRVVALVIDAVPDDLRGETFEVLTPHDLFAEDEFHRLATAYDAFELCCAAKPMLLAHLLEVSASVHYLDADIRFHSDPRFIDALVRQHGIVLTPHLTAPPHHWRSGVQSVEDVLLRGGIFNLGYIGVGRTADPRFLPWWSERVRRDCLNQADSSRFVDQRWIDMVPGYFAHEVLRHPGVNLGWWNMPERRIAHREGQWTVDGEPLVFHHASGYDPEVPHSPSRYQNRIHPFRATDGLAVYALLDDYGAAILAAGHGQEPATDAGLGRVPGLEVSFQERRHYREALLASERDGSPEPPNPFRDGAMAFSDGCAWTSPTDARIRPPGEGTRTPGINLVGYLTARNGIGMAARLVAASLARADIPHSTYNIEHSGHDADHPWSDIGDARYEVTLVCVPMDAAVAVDQHVLGPDLRGGYRIGLWWWEADVLPAAFDPSFTAVDEVWTGSEFARRAIAARTELPVRVMPLALTVTANPRAGVRREVGATDHTFLVVSVLSLQGGHARKNPLGAIDAYRRAFAPTDGALLVMKIFGADGHAADLNRIRYAARDRDDVIIIAASWPIEDVHALIAGCDCMLSMHRSEGFGITLAEAMAYGRPVVATAYGGNTEFMDDTTAFPVPFTLTPIPDDAAPYPVGGEWASPDISAAAGLLRAVRADPIAAAARGRAGRERIEQSHSPGRAGAFIASALQGLMATRLSDDQSARRTTQRRMRRHRVTDSEHPARVHLSRHLNDDDPVRFYHSVALPDGRMTPGQWSIGDINEYLGRVALRGRRVLDAGTATGLLGLTAEQRGAHGVVVVDLLTMPHDADSDPIAHLSDEERTAVRTMRSTVRQSFWECHAALGSSARLWTGPVGSLADDLGRFDVGILGNVLQHVDNPSAVLRVVADICNVLVVTEADWQHRHFRDDTPGVGLSEPSTSFASPSGRPAVVTDLLALHGFGQACVTHHVQRFSADPDAGTDHLPAGIAIPHFTAVCWRDGIPRRHVR